MTKNNMERHIQLGNHEDLYFSASQTPPSLVASPCCGDPIALSHKTPLSLNLQPSLDLDILSYQRNDDRDFSNANTYGSNDAWTPEYFTPLDLCCDRSPSQKDDNGNECDIDLIRCITSPAPVWTHGFPPVDLSHASLRDHDDLSQKVGQWANRASEICNGRFRCSHPNCKISCKRKSDLRRHEVTMHRSRKMYWCPIRGCSRSENDCGARRPFLRRDKRDEHIRKIHQRRIEKSGSDVANLCEIRTYQTSQAPTPQVGEYLASESWISPGWFGSALCTQDVSQSLVETILCPYNSIPSATCSFWSQESMSPDLSCVDGCNNMSFTATVDNSLAACAASWDCQQKSVTILELDEQWDTLDLNLGANQAAPRLTNTLDDLDESLASFMSIATEPPDLTNVHEESCEYIVTSQNE